MSRLSTKQRRARRRRRELYRPAELHRLLMKRWAGFATAPRPKDLWSDLQERFLGPVLDRALANLASGGMLGTLSSPRRAWFTVRGAS